MKIQLLSCHPGQKQIFNVVAKIAYYVVSATLLTGLLASMAKAEEMPAPGQVSIASVQMQGSACKPGTSSATLSPDNSAISVLFDTFTLDVTRQRGDRQEHGLCTLVLKLNMPTGWTFNIFNVDTRGFASLEEGSRAVQRTVFGMNGERAFDAIHLRGPFADNFFLTATVPVRQRAWNRCSAGSQETLRLRTAAHIYLGPRAQQGIITVDSVDGAFTQDFAMEWKRCTPGRPVPPDMDPNRPGRQPPLRGQVRCAQMTRDRVTYDRCNRCPNGGSNWLTQRPNVQIKRCM